MKESRMPGSGPAYALSDEANRMRRYVGTLPFFALLFAISFAVLSESAAPSSKEDTQYTVKDGTQVDAKTLDGWKTWRALACERCHGAAQEGMVGPSLLDSLKNLSKEDFHAAVMNGRVEKGMPPFNTSEMMNKNWEGLYAYLKGRSDGNIKPGRLTAIDKQ
jgi:mono/diheme cytochrome c family protein